MQKYVKIRFRYVLLVGLLVSLTINVYASRNYYFKQLSLENGLTNSFVKCVIRDNNGFLWIGTKSGLNRYDGNEFKHFLSNTEDNRSLPINNNINFILEDSAKNIWVSTSAGLCRYIKETDDFDRIMIKGKPLLVQSYCLTNNEIWFGGRGKIYKYKNDNQEIDTIPLRWHGYEPSFISHIVKWTSKYYLLSTRWDGLWLMDAKTLEVKRPTFCDEKEISSVFVDKNSILWISPYGKGLYGYEIGGEMLYNYDTRNSELSNDVILDIENRFNQLWLATDGGGINILNLDSKKFSNIKYVPGDNYSFPVSSVFCLYRDANNNIWAGTIRGGLFGIKEVYMRTYKDASASSHYGLSDKTVLSLYEDSDQSLWIGTDGGGINHLSPKNHSFKHFSTTYNCKVASITKYSDTELLVYLFAKGLYIFNKHTGSLTPFVFVDNEQNERIKRSGISVNLDNFDTDKIHMFADKMYLYNKKDKSFKRIHVTDSTKYYGGLQRISSNKEYTYLFGWNYILKLDNHADLAHCILSLDYKATINAVYADKTGDLWIGTNKGLMYYNVSTHALKKIETKMFREVTSLVCADQGVWVGADGMLFLYSLKSGKFLIFGESDGASPNEYLMKPSHVASNGDVYMGGVSGLLRIDRTLPFEPEEKGDIKILLSNIILDGVSVVTNVDKDNLIDIRWDHTSLTMNFMVLETDIFRKKLYRFYIDGVTHSYVETYSHTFTANSLPQGTHNVMVSYSMRDGNWSKPQCVLKLHVLAPWWEQLWFIVIMILLAIIVVFWLTRYFIVKKENALKLEMKERERKTYEDKVRFLINISHELRTPLTLIYTPLKRLLNRDIHDESFKDQLAGIFKQARQMRNIINMVLDMRRMEVGSEAFQIAPHKINDWVMSVETDFESEFQQKNIAVKYDLDSSIDMVSFDEGKCEIVLSNLLMNALKFSLENTTITLSTKSMGNSVRVAVSDEGLGLSDEDLKNLFTRFYRGEHQIKGSGIGLSYSKTLLEMFGGSIGAYNNDVKGATFWFELSLIESIGTIACEPGSYLNDLINPALNQYSSESTEFAVKSYSILIIDDVKEIRDLIKESYKDDFKHIYMAEDGEDGLRMVKQYQPDLIISDVMMPRMDGFEFCRALKTDIEISHIPVILLTARNNQESTDIGYKVGADFYLPKPFDTEQLLTIIRSILQNREQIKKHYHTDNFHPTIHEECTFSNADEQFMRKLNKLITENLSDPILDVKFITNNIGMSRASLYAKVKVLADMGVNDYINRIRIDKSIELLLNTDMTITEISEKTGFSNARYFSTAFRQVTEMSPSEYKKRHKKSN